MRQKSNFKSRKKGFMALEQLVGLMLTSIAFIMLIGYLYTFIMDQPQNQKIAESNMLSIRDFLDYSNNKYKNYNTDCFTQLKLTNLENFQFNEGDYKKNYFYILDNNAIYIFKASNYEDIINKIEDQTFDITKNYVKKVELKSNINFLKDETDGGSSIGQVIDEFNPILFMDLVYSFGKANSKLNLESNKIDYIIFYPSSLLSESIVAQKSFRLIDSDYSQNLLFAKIVEKGGNIEEIDYPNLFFRINSNSVIIPEEDLSYLILSANLCSDLELQKQMNNNFFLKKDSKGNYINMDKIDTINQEITFYNTNSQCIYEFVWSREPICKDKNQNINCSYLFNRSMQDITFKEFSEQVFNFYKYNSICPYDDMNIKLRDLTLQEINSKPYKINYKDLFILYENNNQAINVYKLPQDKKEEYVYDLANWIGYNNEFNNVIEEYSNDLAFLNKKYYFYLEGTKNTATYYAFKHQYLRKSLINNNLKVYFNGKEAHIENVNEVDKYGSSISNSDNRKVMWLKIEIENKKYDILLTNYQFSSIPVLVQ